MFADPFIVMMTIMSNIDTLCQITSFEPEKMSPIAVNIICKLLRGKLSIVLQDGVSHKFWFYPEIFVIS